MNNLLGVYFDFAFNGSSTVFLSLRNEEKGNQRKHILQAPMGKAALSNFPKKTKPAALPVSLLVKINDDEYVVFPEAASIVAVRNRNLNPLQNHVIRVIAPMVQNGKPETLQVEGIFLDNAAQLQPPSVWAGVSVSPEHRRPADEVSHYSAGKRMLEVITDLPGVAVSRHQSNQGFEARGIFAGVMGWDYLLGEMFNADHASISIDGMCLVRNCIGGRDSPETIADTFFRRYV